MNPSRGELEDKEMEKHMDQLRRESHALMDELLDILIRPWLHGLL
jgi:hypothetical protein